MCLEVAVEEVDDVFAEDNPVVSGSRSQVALVWRIMTKPYNIGGNDAEPFTLGLRRLVFPRVTDPDL